MQTKDAPGVTASAAVTGRVLAYLAEHERSRAWLARRLPMNDATLSRRLAGQQPWTLDELEQLEQAIGIPVDRLVARDGVEDEVGDHLAETGSARVVGLVLVVLGAVVVGWVAPYGVPVAALLAAVVLALLAGALVVGGLARSSDPGEVVRARRLGLLVVGVAVAVVTVGTVTYAVPADARARPPASSSCGLPYVPGRHCVPPVRPSYSPTPVVGAPSPTVTRGTIHVPTATSTAP